MRQTTFKLRPFTFTLAERDILTAPVDVIVNQANSQLVHGGGLAAAIAKAAGKIFEHECHELVERFGPVATCDVVLTSSGKLADSSSIKAVIHTVGPRMGEGDEQHKLEKAFSNCIRLANGKGFHSVAIPAISTGIFGVDSKICAHAVHDALFKPAMECKSLNEVWLCVTERDYDIFSAILSDSEETTKSSESHVGTVSLDADDVERLNHKDSEIDDWFKH